MLLQILIHILLKITNNKMKLRHASDKVDIDNNIKFRYYEVTEGKYVKINNQYPCSLYCKKIGKEIELIIDKTHKGDLLIKLSYDGEKYYYLRVKNEDIDITRITLICSGFNSEYGSSWYVKKYNGNISIE